MALDNAAGTSSDLGSTSAPAPSTGVTSPDTTAEPSAAASLERASTALSAEPSTAQPEQEGANIPGATGQPPAQPRQDPNLDRRGQGGAPPEARWPSILQNTRVEARQEGQLHVLNALGIQVSDAESARQAVNEIREVLAINRRLNEHPRQFVQQVVRELQERGEWEDDTEEELVDPEPSLRSADGSLTAYSAADAKQLVANAVARVKRELMGEVQPALEYAQTAQQREAMEQTTAQAREIATEVYSHMQTLSGFKENEKAIGEVLAKVPPRIRARYGTPACLMMAYNKVMQEQVLPIRDQQTENRTIQNLQRTAAAGNGSVQPAGAQNTKPAIREGNVDDLATHMRNLASRVSV